MSFFKKTIFIITLFLLPSFPCLSEEVQIDDKAQRIEMLNIYLGELETLWKIQQTAAKEHAENSSSMGILSSSITTGTRTINAVNSINDQLNALKLSDNYNKIRTILVNLNEERFIINKAIVDGAKFLMSAKPSDLETIQKMGADAAERVAQVEDLNSRTFKASVAVGLGLYDEKRVDKKGNMNRLIITEKQRKDILAFIDRVFGEELDKQDQNFFVAGAGTIKYELTLRMLTADAP